MRKWFWVLDATVVMSFVIIGRDSHGFVTDWSETMRVAAPFLIALAIGIIVMRAWLKPLQIVTGLGIAAITVVLGLMIRHFVFDAGIAQTFMILTTGWMFAWMVGWRLVAGLIIKFAANRRTASAI
ncbi:MAG: DUF3054 family protein [Proteobacteria bacterium]|nr:DUF3054 family protein [Pseudomonadota bacterium]